MVEKGSVKHYDGGKDPLTTLREEQFVKTQVASTTAGGGEIQLLDLPSL